MGRAGLRSIIVAAIGVVAAAQTGAPAGGLTVLQHAEIHTISGPIIPNGSIFIRDGKIVGVGRDLSPPEGATVIDVSGKRVYPGMIDSASRIGMQENDAEESDDAEPGLLNPQLRSYNAVNPSSPLIPAARANGVTSAVTLPDGPLLSGQLSLLRLNGAVGDALVRAPVVAIHLRFPSLSATPPRKYETSEDDEEPGTAVEEKELPAAQVKATYLEQMRALNNFFAEARRYWHSKARQRAPNRRYEAILPVLEGATPLFVTAIREREIREAIAFAAKQKIRIVLADAYEAYKALDAIKANRIPVVLGPTLSLPLNRDDPYDRSFTTPAALYQAGVLFSIGTFGARSVRNLPFNAAAAVPFGLPEEEAYKAVSLNAAEILGVSKTLGSIEEGKAADLIVADGSPLESGTHITTMMIDGKLVDLRLAAK